jgi:hypothetical protein
LALPWPDFATHHPALNDAFNYVAVLVSIVLGFAATRLLGGLSEMIQVANRPRTYWVHTLWIVNYFADVMLYWWTLYRWHDERNWTFFLFVWVTLFPILIYLSSAVLFPGELENTGSASWRDYYYKNRRGFFLPFGAIGPLDIVDTLLKGRQHFIDQGPLYVPFIAIWTFGFLAAILTRNPKYHAVWAVAFPTVVMSYVAIVMLRMG